MYSGDQKKRRLFQVQLFLDTQNINIFWVSLTRNVDICNLKIRAIGRIKTRNPIDAVRLYRNTFSFDLPVIVEKIVIIFLQLLNTIINKIHGSNISNAIGDSVRNLFHDAKIEGEKK